jgi:hypothetical protein
LGYALRREREGKAVQHRETVIDGTSPRIPIESFQEWLKAYQTVTGLDRAELARELGMTERRIGCVLKGEYKKVSLDVVDSALLRAQRAVCVRSEVVVTLDDLYPVSEL